MDEAGRVVPDSEHLITFAAAGGSIVGTANGDPASHVPATSASRPAFHGLVMAVVRAGRQADGSLVVSATAPKLRGATLDLPLLGPPSAPSQAAE